MEQSGIIKVLRDALSDLISKGQYFVHIPSLNNYLDALEKSAESSIELRRLQHQSNLEWYKATRESELEMFRSVIQAGQTALKTVILINGGAAVALLAFLGNVWADSEPPAHILNSLLAFCAGVLLGGLATGTTYLTQAVYASEYRILGHIIKYFTILLVIAAYLGFALGAYNAYVAFGSYGSSYTST